MKIAVGYTRVSSSSQASPEKSSLERQAEKIELQARLKEYKLLKIYREPGISGATMDRLALQELMANAENWKFDAVIVWDISRFGRNLLHLKQNTDKLKELEIATLTYCPCRTPAPPAGGARSKPRFTPRDSFY